MSRNRKQDLPRVKWLRKEHAMRVLDAGRSSMTREWFTRSHHRVFDYLLAFDPTPKGIYFQRVLEWFEDGKIRLEDARIVRDILEAFHSRKHALPVDERDIGRYSDPGAIAKRLDGNMALMRPVPPAHLADGSEKVASGDDWEVHRITTPEAAKWWAKGTTWCTGSKRTADDYLADDPLHVLVLGGDKWQFHVDSAQFANRYDQMIHDLDGIPTAAIEAMREIASRPSKPEALLHRLDLQAMMQRNLEARAAGTSPVAVKTKESWLHLASGATLRMRGSAHDFVPLALRADGTEIPLDSTQGRALVMDLAKHLCIRAGKGQDGVFAVDALTWLTPQGGSTGHRMCVMIDGEPRAYIAQRRDDDGSSFMHVLNLDDPDLTPHEVARIGDFENLDDDMQDCVRLFYGRITAPVHMRCIIGIDALGEAAREKLKRTWLRPHDIRTLETLATPQDASSNDSIMMERVEQVIRNMVVDPLDAAAMLAPSYSGDDAIISDGLVKRVIESIAAGSSDAPVRRFA